MAEDAPKPIPSARQEITEHIRTLIGEEGKVRAKIASYTRGLAISDQQLAGLLALQEDYRLALTVLPEDPDPHASLTNDWMALRRAPAEVATDKPKPTPHVTGL